MKKERVSELRDSNRNYPREEQQEKILTKKKSCKDPWDSIRISNTCVIGVPGEERMGQTMYLKK